MRHQQSQAANLTPGAVNESMLAEARQYFTMAMQGDTEAKMLYMMTRICGKGVDPAWVDEAGQSLFRAGDEYFIVKETFDELRRLKKLIDRMGRSPRLSEVPVSKLQKLNDVEREVIEEIRKYDEALEAAWPKVPAQSLEEQLHQCSNGNTDKKNPAPIAFSIYGALLDDYLAGTPCLFKSGEKESILQEAMALDVKQASTRSHDEFFATLFPKDLGEAFDVIICRIRTVSLIRGLEEARELLEADLIQRGAEKSDIQSYLTRYARTPNEETLEHLQEKMEKRWPSTLSCTPTVHVSPAQRAANIRELALQEAEQTITQKLQALFPSESASVRGKSTTSLFKLHTKMGVDLEWLLRIMENQKPCAASAQLVENCTVQARQYNQSSHSPVTHHAPVVLNETQSLQEMLKKLSDAPIVPDAALALLKDKLDEDEPKQHLIEGISYFVLKQLAQFSAPLKRINILERLANLPLPTLLPEVFDYLCQKKFILTGSGLPSTGAPDELLKIDPTLKQKFQ